MIYIEWLFCLLIPLNYTTVNNLLKQFNYLNIFYTSLLVGIKKAPN